MEHSEAFFRWLEIREQNGILLSTAQQLRIDADHSSLLRRLQEDGEVFPEAPPRAYSYPWCDLIRAGIALPFEVHHGPDLRSGPDSLLIEQCGDWRILERLGEDSFIATYEVVDQKAFQELRNDYARYQAFLRSELELPKKLSDSRWKVYVAGVMVNLPDRKQWVVERLQ